MLNEQGHFMHKDIKRYFRFISISFDIRQITSLISLYLGFIVNSISNDMQLFFNVLKEMPIESRIRAIALDLVMVIKSIEYRNYRDANLITFDDVVRLNCYI